jgi:hypothetical protein
MPRGPRGGKRPADVIGAAIMVAEPKPGKRGPYKKRAAT